MTFAGFFSQIVIKGGYDLSILPFIFAVPSLTANDIAIVNSYYYHNHHKDTSHTPDDDHPKRNVFVYRKKITKMKYDQVT